MYKNSLNSIKSLNSLDSLLRNILLSHVVVREFPENNNNKTLVRIHLMPFNNYCVNSILYPKNIIKQKRNTHVSHLPKYKKITNDQLQQINTDSNTNSDTNNQSCILNECCSICHDKFKTGEYFRKLPICNHIYHKKCIDKWFITDSKNMRCPICRTSHTKEQWDIYQTAIISMN
jgi:hypothetical protein